MWKVYLLRSHVALFSRINRCMCMCDKKKHIVHRKFNVIISFFSLIRSLGLFSSCLQLNTEKKSQTHIVRLIHTLTLSLSVDECMKDVEKPWILEIYSHTYISKAVFSFFFWYYYDYYNYFQYFCESWLLLVFAARFFLCYLIEVLGLVYKYI